ncbi:MAG TPA: PH domain-containing protein [Flavisolibacter sp.]|nr:PH domain-containing protein [Flavisolibacter sp.]
MEVEKTIYQTCPSQLRNFQPFFFGIVAAAAIVITAVLSGNNLFLIGLILPVIYLFWKWLEIKTTRLTITDQRIIVSQGVLNKETNETELYRVRDTSIEEPILYRLFGLGTVIVYTTDEAKATHRFVGYRKPHWVKDQIRNYAEVCRQKKRWGNDNVLLQDHVE